jgi:ATP-dependent protease ClpP protease subunit
MKTSSEKILTNSTTELFLNQEKKPSAYFTDKPMIHVHEYYLVGQIEEASNYTEWFNQIRHCPPTDLIKIYINSGGGDLWAAIQFMRVIRECKATVIVSVEGACMSAATIIFLMADDYEITPHSMFMFHNYSGGTMGKGGEMIDQVKHERKWSQELLKEIYSDFLDSSEINSILDNKDIWMTGEEVVQRLNKRNKVASKKKPGASKK